MSKFFHDLLFCEGGAYTLWGHKPVTEIVLYHYTHEEWSEMFANLPKEELENCYIEDQYDLPANWLKWEKIADQFPMHKFLLFRSHFSEDKECSFVYFVNILQTAAIIEQNYEIFRKNVGFDFHPLDVVLQMPDPKSEFWIKIRNSEDGNLLWGLLFGYGKINSLMFSWKYKESPLLVEQFFSSTQSHRSIPDPKGQVRISISNFDIPAFISFQDEDVEITRYKNERDIIKKKYNNGNLLDITLKRLTSK